MANNNSPSDIESQNSEDFSLGAKQPKIRPVFRLILFFLMVAIPFLVVARVWGFFPFSRTAGNYENDLFPNALAVGAGDLHVEFTSTPTLSPTQSRDFLLVSWFQLRKSLSNGQRMVLVSNSDLGDGDPGGYALAVTGEGENVRPLVYWNSEDGGKWYRFTEIDVPAHAWVMYALSLQNGRYLGLHVAIVTPGKVDIKLLGGYDLSQDSTANAVSTEPVLVKPSMLPLTLAPTVNNRFIGHIGPFGIFHLRELTGNLHELLKGLSRDPLNSMDLFKKREVALWWPDGDRDLSSEAHAVAILGSNRGRNQAATSQ